MKIKIFLIIMIILFAASCTKNNPANPLQNTDNVTKNNADSDNTSSKNDISNSENVTGNNTDSDNTSSKNDISSSENKTSEPNFEDDGYVEFRGKAKSIAKKLDGTELTEFDPENVYVDINEKDKSAVVNIPTPFYFNNIKLDNSKHTYYSRDYRGEYTLTMKVENDSITEFQFIIFDKSENIKYYYETDRLYKLQKN